MKYKKGRKAPTNITNLVCPNHLPPMTEEQNKFVKTCPDGLKLWMVLRLQVALFNTNQR